VLVCRFEAHQNLASPTLLSFPNLTLQCKLLLAAAAGLLNWAVFPTTGLWPLAWICQVPLLVALFREPSGWRSALIGLVSGFVFFAGTCHWIGTVLSNYGGLHWVGASLLFLLLALYLSLFYALFAWAFSRLSLSGGSLCFWMAPAVWVATEYLRGYVLTGFPWCLLGYGMVDAVNLVQIAKWTGVYGLSYACISVSACVAGAVVRPSRLEALRLIGVVSVLLCLVLGFAWTRRLPESPAHIARIVQTNIALDEELDAIARLSLLDELAGISTAPMEGDIRPPNAVRLILWPETPAAFYFNHDLGFRQHLEKIAVSAGAYLCFGFVDFRPAHGKELERAPYNSIGMLSPEGRAISQYDKIHLVPFGEYIPYERFFFFVDKISTEAGNFQPGDRIVVTPLDGQRSVGAFVCYEAVVPDLVRRFARDGSQVLVNLTNDAWFGESAAPFQHLAMARMRAIENDRYLLRAANNGISAIIDPMGRISKAVARNQRVALEGRFSFERQLTFYSQYGDVFAMACLASCLLVGAWRGVEWKRGSTNAGRDAWTRNV